MPLLGKPTAAVKSLKVLLLNGGSNNTFYAVNIKVVLHRCDWSIVTTVTNVIRDHVQSCIVIEIPICTFFKVTNTTVKLWPPTPDRLHQWEGSSRSVKRCIPRPTVEGIEVKGSLLILRFPKMESGNQKNERVYK